MAGSGPAMTWKSGAGTYQFDACRACAHHGAVRFTGNLCCRSHLWMMARPMSANRKRWLCGLPVCQRPRLCRLLKSGTQRMEIRGGSRTGEGPAAAAVHPAASVFIHVTSAFICVPAFFLRTGSPPAPHALASNRAQLDRSPEAPPGLLMVPPRGSCSTPGRARWAVPADTGPAPTAARKCRASRQPIPDSALP